MINTTVDQSNLSTNTSIDLTVTISVIIALCAIISPVLVAVINNRNQLKMRNLELKHDEDVNNRQMVYNHVVSLFEAYLGSLEGCMKNMTYEAEEKYGVALGNALIYASHTSQSTMLDIDDKVKNSSIDTIEQSITRSEISNISAMLRADLENYKK